MKPQLYLHIGQPKSATTSIQGFLFRNRGMLMTQGYLYPKAGIQDIAHHPLGNFFSSIPFDWIEARNPVNVKAALVEEMMTSGCDKVIMSTESLYYPSVQPVLIKQYFEGFDITILLTLRRQDEWMESALRDNIKTGVTTGDDVSEYVSSRSHHIDYKVKAACWAKIFGKENIRISTFEPGKETISVEQSFLQVIGAKFSKEMLITPPLNERLSRDCLDFLRMMSHTRRISAPYWTYFAILEEYSKLHPDTAEHRYIISPNIRDQIMRAHAASNTSIATEYLNRRNLFRDDNLSEPAVWALYPGLNSKAAVLIGEFLANRLFALRLQTH